MGKKKKKKKKSKKNQLFRNESFNLNSDSKFSVFEVIVIIFISIIFGIIIGYLVTYSNSSLHMIRSDSGLREIVDTYHNISGYYYKEIDEDKLINAAVRGMVEALDDPYSMFLDDTSADQFNQSVDGMYIDVGISVSYDGEYNRIVDLHEDGSAKKEGVFLGDIVLSIDGEDCHYLSGEDFQSLLQGKVGTKLNMIVLRDNKELSFSLTRKKLEVVNVKSQLFTDEINVGYISISLFSSNSYEQFKKQLKALEKKKIQALIIDVRNNPGGHLLQAREVLSMFFDKKTVLYQLKSNGTIQKVYSATKDTRSYPVALLVNQDTASAAEVLVAAFSDNYKNLHIVGTRTYGKGTVQKSQNLSTGISIKFTVQQWLTPTGEDIDGIGIEPDVVMEVSFDYYENPSYDNDAVLKKAIQLLKESKD